jgi:hypothetical protein
MEEYLASVLIATRKPRQSAKNAIIKLSKEMFCAALAFKKVKRKRYKMIPKEN